MNWTLPSWKDLSPTILDLYLLRRFCVIYLSTLVAFVSLYVVVDAVSNMDDFADRTDGAGELLLTMARCYGAIVPVVFCEILGPVVAVTSAMFTVTVTQRANEFVPVLASGCSYQRALAPLLIAGLAISLGVFAMQELWIPHTAEVLRETSIKRKGHDFYRNVRYPDNEFGKLIVFRNYRRETKSGEGVLVHPIRGELHITARTAEWIENDGDGHWLLRDGGIQKLVNRKHWQPIATAHAVETRENDAETRENDASEAPKTENLEAEGPKRVSRLRKSFDEYILETSLIPEDIELGREETVSMPLGTILRKAEISIDAKSWRVKYLGRFTFPFTNFILVLLGLPIIVYFGSRNIFVGAILAVAVCTTYFALNAAFQESGIRGVLPARVGAIFAPVLFTAAGATIYRSIRS